MTDLLPLFLNLTDVAYLLVGATVAAQAKQSCRGRASGWSAAGREEIVDRRGFQPSDAALQDSPTNHHHPTPFEAATSRHLLVVAAATPSQSSVPSAEHGGCSSTRSTTRQCERVSERVVRRDG